MSSIVNLHDWKEEQSQGSDSEKKLFLTEKQVRSNPGFENIPDEEVIHIINTLHQFSLLTYEVVTAELNEQRFDRKAA